MSSVSETVKQPAIRTREMQAADQVPDLSTDRPAPRGEATFEWAGRSET